MISVSPVQFVVFFLLFFPLSEIAQSIEKTDATRPPFQVAVLYWSMDIPGQVAMRRGLEQAADKINEQAIKKNLISVQLYPQVAGNGERGIERQIMQMEKIIEQQKFDLIIIQPTDNAALSKSLKKANQKNIPVVAYDQYIKGGHLASYITSDNYQAGYLGGEYIASKFENDYPLKLIIVEYPYVSSTVERVDGFIDGLSESKQAYRIIKSYQAVDPESGEKAAKQMLMDFPGHESIDVVFTVNDGGGLSIVSALIDAGRNEIMVATIDGDPASIENIRLNRLTVIDSAQFCYPIGEEAINTAYDILNGKAVSPYKRVPVFPVTKETLTLYPGWRGEIPSEFTKPWESSKPVWNGEITSSGI